MSKTADHANKAPLPKQPTVSPATQSGELDAPQSDVPTLQHAVASPPPALRNNNILTLQRRLGNQAVQQMLNKKTQSLRQHTESTIRSRSGDLLEQLSPSAHQQSEAAAAESAATSAQQGSAKQQPAVMRMSDQVVQRRCACGEITDETGECAQCREKRLSIQRQAVDQSEATVAPTPADTVFSSHGYGSNGQVANPTTLTVNRSHDLASPASPDLQRANSSLHQEIGDQEVPGGTVPDLATPRQTDDAESERSDDRALMSDKEEKTLEPEPQAEAAVIAATDADSQQPAPAKNEEQPEARSCTPIASLTPGTKQQETEPAGDQVQSEAASASAVQTLTAGSNGYGPDRSQHTPVQRTVVPGSQVTTPTTRPVVQRIGLSDLNPLDAAKKLAEAALGAIRSLGGTALSTAQNLGNAALSTAKDAGSAAWNTAKSAGTSAWNTVKGAGQDIWNTAKSAGTSVWNKAKGLGQDAWNKAKGLGQDAWNTGKNLGTSALNLGKNLGTSAWNTAKSAGSNAWNTAKGLGQGAWDAAKSAGSKASSAVQGAGSKAWDTIKNASSKALSTAKDLGGKAVDTATSLKQKFIEEAKKDPCSYLKPMVGLRNMAVKALTPAVEKAWSTAKDLGGKTWNQAKQLGGTMLNTAREWGGKALSTAKGAVDKAVGGAKNLGNKVLSTAKEWGSKAVSGAKNAMTTALNQAKSLGTKALSTAKNLGQNVANTAKDLGTQALNKAKNLGQNVANTAKNLGSNILNTAKGAADKVRGLADKLTGGMASKVAGMANQILGKAAGLLSFVVSIAKGLADKALSTAKSLASKALSTAKEWGSKALNTAKDVGSKAFSTAKEWGGKALNTATDLGSKALSTAKDLGGKALSTAKEWGGKALSTAKDLGGKALSTAKDLGGKALSTAKDWGGKALSTAKDWGGKALSTAKDWGGKALNVAKDWGGKALNVAKKLGGEKVWNAAKSLGDKAWGIIKKAGPALEWIGEKAASGIQCALKAAGIPKEVMGLVDVITDFVPGVSNIKDGIIALTGINPVTGEKVSPIERAMAAAFAIPVLGNVLKGGKLTAKVVKYIGEGLTIVAAKVGPTVLNAIKALPDTIRSVKSATRRVVRGAEELIDDAWNGIKHKLGKGGKEIDLPQGQHKRVDGSVPDQPRAGQEPMSKAANREKALSPADQEQARNAIGKVEEPGPISAELRLKYGEDAEQIIEKYDEELGTIILSTFDRIADVPGADRLMKDLLSRGHSTAQGALSELGYAASLRKQGFEIEKLADVINKKKAADIVIKGGPVIDVKDYNWLSPHYKSPANIKRAIDRLVKQAELHQRRYPGRKVEFAFTDLKNMPPSIREALEGKGFDVKAVTWIGE